MRMSEIAVNENLLKMLGFGKNAATAAVKTGADDAAGAAAKARGDAFLKRATGGVQAATTAFKAGDIVNVNLRAYKNQPQFAMSAKVPHSGLDSDIAKVVEIVPLPNSIDKFVAKVETIPGKARQEPIMYKGQNLGWKDVPPETTQYTIPVEFLSIRK